jgi:hypothetical protein
MAKNDFYFRFLAAPTLCPAPLRTYLGVDGIIDIIRQCAGRRYQQDISFWT